MERIWKYLKRKYRLYWLAGALLWTAIAVASWQWARSSGQPYLQTMVTWDEWAVSVLLLPWLGSFLSVGLSVMTRGSRVNTAMQNVMYGGNPNAVAHQVEEDMAAGLKGSRRGLGSTLGAVAVVVFVLDLLVRAVFGLGWQPFL